MSQKELQNYMLTHRDDQESYDQYLKPLEYRYDQKDNYERIEVVVNQSLFPLLNQFPRVLKPR